MLQKSKSKKIFQLKYLLLLPLVAVMLTYTACSQEKDAGNTEGTAKLTTNTNSDSEILQKIAELKESIAARGSMTKEEEDALRVLMVLTQKDGFDNAMFDPVKDKVEIPYGVIDQPPIFPGCEELDKESARKCTTQKIGQFVGETFNTKVGNEAGLEGKSRISVIFKIDRYGNVGDIKARAPHPNLETEAKRVVSLLPKMKPGEHKGKVVSVTYALPIVFEFE